MPIYKVWCDAPFEIVIGHAPGFGAVTEDTYPECYYEATSCRDAKRQFVQEWRWEIDDTDGWKHIHVKRQEAE